MYRERIADYLPVYLVMGLEHHGDRTALEIAKEALEGGVTLFQLREKKAPLRQVLEQGAELRDLCRQYGVPFLVNDRIDVALLLDADGVHVGQDDVPGLEARKLLGDSKIIGISAGNREEAEWAIAQGADYLGVGAVYATSTKEDAGAAIGTGLIREIAGRWDVPMVGIGGIHKENAAAVIQAGARGIAVVSAITKQSDPRSAAALLKQTVLQTKE
ncbi:thiamine phosphate synthase [Paenibacillus sp. OAS669]|uniref:thiamine phosphate synthase n=1 Tax=Paenibacillus sp. OAS669 TaxID=2663821 RepID=UPI0017897172|nr:thiamine phosphate synthase [Paenibacillus sp. OAS669]MBE1447025.1 thiamine-phosphate pyrophosphorylase [Paenibacillus sp. OAS669]